MALGGTRPGAGRPRKRDLYQAHIRAAEHKILDRLPEIVDWMLTLAEGVRVQDTDLTGQLVVYQRPPDRASCEYLMDRIMGKPTQPYVVREQAERVAALLGVDVQEVLHTAEQLKAGRR